MTVKKFKLLTDEEDQAFHDKRKFSDKSLRPLGTCFISYCGETDEAQLSIYLTTKDKKVARARANSFIEVVNRLFAELASQQ